MRVFKFNFDFYPTFFSILKYVPSHFVSFNFIKVRKRNIIIYVSVHFYTDNKRFESFRKLSAEVIITSNYSLLLNKCFSRCSIFLV